QLPSLSSPPLTARHDLLSLDTRRVRHVTRHLALDDRQHLLVRTTKILTRKSRRRERHANAYSPPSHRRRHHAHREDCVQKTAVHRRLESARSRARFAGSRWAFVRHSRFCNCIQDVHVYQVTMKLCVHVREARIAHAELRDQAERASVSTFLAV